MDDKTEKFDNSNSISKTVYIYQFVGNPLISEEVALKSVPVEPKINKNDKISTFSSCN